jgi:hypothetical protein
MRGEALASDRNSKRTMKRPIGLPDLPQFTVLSSERRDDRWVLVGKLTSPQYVSEGTSWLRTPSGYAVNGKIVSLSATGIATFETYEDLLPEGIASGRTVPWVHGFWDPDQVDVILDLHRDWAKVTFEAGQALESSIPGWRIQRQGSTATQRSDEVVVDAAWDHEHCLICSARISPGEVAFVDSDNNWLCPECHETFAVSHDLSFLLGSVRRPDA